MFKKILWILTVPGVLGLGFGVNYLTKALPILTGYGAKNLCSGVFVAGRSESSVISEELGAMPVSLGTFQVDRAERSATSHVMGFASRKAIYREGLGCMLLAEVTADERKPKPDELSERLNEIAKPADSLYWPYGSLMQDTLYSNVDYNRLAEVVDRAFREDDPEVKRRTRAVVVVYKGRIIAEQYADGFTKDTPQAGWSMTKSITATVLGMMIKDGMISLQSRNLLAIWNKDERSEITIDHLLRMNSGLEWEEKYTEPSGATDMLYKKADMGRFAAEKPLTAPPGEHWYYSSGTTNILSMIMRQNLQGRYYNYIRDRLFSPLAMTNAVIEADPSGTYVGSSYMYATPRDWAKLGILYLNKGRWNGRQLLPEYWSGYVSTPAPGARGGIYGAHFWLNAGEPEDEGARRYPDAPTDMYSANGYEGQRVFIVPSEQLVVVRMGQTRVRGSFDFNGFMKEILATVR